MYLVLCFALLCSAFCSRFVNALVFFGISLNVGNLAGDMYLNFFILSIVELPGSLLMWLFMSRYSIVLLLKHHQTYTILPSADKRNIPFCIL